jgi:hypothetical protein
MAKKRARKSGKRVADLKIDGAKGRNVKDVMGGREPTKHPAKVTIPDLK